MSDVLARPVIEIGVDEMRLADELGGAQRQIAKSMAESLNRTKLEKTERSKLYDITKSLAYADTSRARMMAGVQRQISKSMVESLSRAKLERAERQKLYDITKGLHYLDTSRVKMQASGSSGGRGQLSSSALTPAMRTLLSGTRNTKYEYAATAINQPSVMNGLNAGVSNVGAGIAGAGGLAFAGAAAAGSTTFNTLTESLKMLSLSAGNKTQAPILALSKLIQKLAKAADSAPNGVVGGISGLLTGAAIGFARGGLAGAAVGAAVGGIGGGAIEKGVNDFADKRKMVEKLKSDPNEIGKLLNEINDLEKPWWSGVPFVGNSVEIAKRRGAIRTAEAKQAQEKDDFKTAGLGGTGSYIGLSDLRQQTQIAGFGPGGVLGLENEMKEMNLNLKALNGNMNMGPKVAQPGNVAPPGG